MSFLKARALLICALKQCTSIVCVGLLFASALHAVQFKEKSEIFSNNMRILAGAGDTIWVASLIQQGVEQGWGITYSLDQGASWRGYYLSAFGGELTDIAYGNKALVALLNPADYANSPGIMSECWSYSHATGNYSQFPIFWSDTVVRTPDIDHHAIDVAFSNGNFYFACQQGGIVRGNPPNSTLLGFLPGDSTGFNPKTFDPSKHPAFGTNGPSVYGIEKYQDSLLVVMTEPRLWLFHPAPATWDSSITMVLDDPTFSFLGFKYAYINNNSGHSLLYAKIAYKKGATELLSLFRYQEAKGAWVLVIKDAPAGIAAASKGYFYSVNGGNQISAFRDSLSDTAAIPASGLEPVLTDQDLYGRLTAKRGMDKPDYLNDLLFVQTADPIGHLWIASTEGLFLSWNENPGISTDTFKLIRRDRAIKTGLKETYALPGILSDDYRNPKLGSTTFIYKLDHDAKVTIRVYDFNLQLVKTIVENAERRAATANGRSTDRSQDVWNGTTASGRPVAPGVYYYKITTSTGERSFGKIVVAKGASN